MLVGAVRRFAVEYEFDERQALAERARFGFGHVRFWLDGAPVGDWTTHTSLGTVAHSLELSIDHRASRRASPRLCALSTAALFAELDWEVFGVGRDDLSVEDPRERGYLLFFVHPMIDTFDGNKIAVVECSHSQRVLWKLASSEPRELPLAPGEFEEIAGTFVSRVRDWMRE